MRLLPQAWIEAFERGRQAQIEANERNEQFGKQGKVTFENGQIVVTGKGGRMTHKIHMGEQQEHWTDRDPARPFPPNPTEAPNWED